MGKVTSHYYNGIFLQYAKTMRNFVYINSATKRIKTSSHAVFDEVHYSQQVQPRGAQILIQHGYTPPSNLNECISTHPRPPVKSVAALTTDTSRNLIVQVSHKDAIIPKQASEKAAGYDLYSVQYSIIQPNCVARINTGIRIQLSPHTYGQIASRSGLVVNQSLTIEGGVIDRDYTGEIQVVLHNFGTKHMQYTKGIE